MVFKVNRTPSWWSLAGDSLYQRCTLLTIVSEHVLLPNSEYFFKLLEIPFARRPLIAVCTVQVHVVELENHRKLLAFFGNVLACLVFVHATWHFSDGAVGVFLQDSLVHFVHIYVDVWTGICQHPTIMYIRDHQENLPIGEHFNSWLFKLIWDFDGCIWKPWDFRNQVDHVELYKIF